MQNELCTNHARGRSQAETYFSRRKETEPENRPGEKLQRGHLDLDGGAQGLKRDVDGAGVTAAR